jgi:hypothetical protein
MPPHDPHGSRDGPTSGRGRLAGTPRADEDVPAGPVNIAAAVTHVATALVPTPADADMPRKRTPVTDSTTVPVPPDRDPVVIDTDVAHASRIYDYLLDGTDNFAVDRDVARHAFAAYPGGLDGARIDARANRAFLARAVRFMAAEGGVRQFLDIGTGIPTAGNTHAVAQQVAPESRIVYVDNDPVVLAHAHSLLCSSSDGATAFVNGDLRRPEAVLEEAAATLDLSRPVALVLVGLLHVIPDEDGPYDHVATLVDAVAPGSFLALSHLSDRRVEHGDMMLVNARLAERMRSSNPPAVRTHAAITRFFDGLELVEPGVVSVPEWRPDPAVATPPAGRAVPLLCGVGRKP